MTGASRSSGDTTAGRRTARRSPAPAERQRDAERTKQRILDAAKSEFGAKGYEAARVIDIATRAGVNKQLISYYFGGKEGLYRTLTAAFHANAGAMTSTEEPVATVARKFVLNNLVDRDMSRLFVWENLGEASAGTLTEDALREFLRRQVDYMRRRQEAGDFPPDLDPAYLLLTLMAAATAGPAMPRLVRAICDADPESEEFTERYADQLGLLLQHLRQPHGSGLNRQLRAEVERDLAEARHEHGPTARDQ